MANQEHVHILKQGAQTWNTWRRAYPEIAPDLSKSDLSRLDLSHLNLQYALFYESELSYTNFNRADLSHADLRQTSLLFANLGSTNLSYANLSQATLFEAGLIGANLRHANLRATDLTKSELFSTIFIDTDLHNAIFNDCLMAQTIFGGVDLSTVAGLNSIVHLGPSHLSINTLALSKGVLPEKFLRGIGVPDAFLPSLSFSPPFEYHTCYISYSYQDKEFAERLQLDLQQLGISCWLLSSFTSFDPLKEQIDEAISSSDTLLLICSSHSLASTWIATTVDHMLATERRTQHSIVIPCLLDNTLLESTQPWVSALLQTHKAIDFLQWKQSDGYNNALDQLLTKIEKY